MNASNLVSNITKVISKYLSLNFVTAQHLPRSDHSSASVTVFKGSDNAGIAHKA